MIETFKEEVTKVTNTQKQVIAVVKSSIEKIKQSDQDVDFRIDGLCQLLDIIVDLQKGTADMIDQLTGFSATMFEGITDKLE